MLKNSITCGGESIAFSYRLATGEKITHTVAPYDFLSTHNYSDLTWEQKCRLIACLRYLAILKGVHVTKPDLFRYANIFRDKILKDAKAPSPELKRELSFSSDSDDSNLSDLTVSENSTPNTSPESSIESKEEPESESPLDWAGVFNLLPPNVQMLWAAPPEAVLVRQLMYDRAIAQIEYLSRDAKTMSCEDANLMKSAIKQRDIFSKLLAKTPQQKFVQAAEVVKNQNSNLLPKTLELNRSQLAARIAHNPLSEEIQVEDLNHFERKKLENEFWMMLWLPVENAKYDKDRRVTNYTLAAAVVFFLLVPILLSVSVTNPILIVGCFVSAVFLASLGLYEKCMHPDGPNYPTKAMIGSVGIIGVIAASLIHGVLPLFLTGAALASVTGLVWPVALCIAFCVMCAWVGTKGKAERNNNFKFFKPKKEDPTVGGVTAGASNDQSPGANKEGGDLRTPLLV